MTSHPHVRLETGHLAASSPRSWAGGNHTDFGVETLWRTQFRL